MTADAVLVNARIYTNQPRQPWANEMALYQGRIMAVGPVGSTRQFCGPGTVSVDLEQALVLPGLCDSHIHFTHYALSLRELDLFEVPTLDQLVHKLHTFALSLPTAAWLVGRGWNQDLWPEKRFPTRQDLDTAVGQRPVLLYAKSGHAAVANSAALQRAGITASTESPEGGFIAKDATGQPTGMLLEGPAIKLVADRIPAPTLDHLEETAQEAQRQLHAWGITAVHDFDGHQGLIVFQHLLAHQRLRLRAVSHLAQDQLDDAIALGIRGPLGNTWLRIGGLKLFADGALGPRTALMVDAYEGEPQNYGMAVVDKEEMLELATRATRHGIATCVHAIGDRANHDVLDVLQEVRRIEADLNLPRPARRHRIEHVQVLQPTDLPRLAQLDIHGAVQPIHATQDMFMVDTYWGQRGRLAYAFRSLLDQGTRLAYGSDAPVETPNPFVGIHAAVTRRRADGTPGPDGWYPAQRLTRAEAIRGYTADAAYLEGQEQVIGTLAPGYEADFFVPDRDLFHCADDEIRAASSRLTVVGGECVHGDLSWPWPDNRSLT